MMIFHKAQLAYLAVPKTASTAIEAALAPHASALLRDPPGLKHSNAKKFDKKLRAIFEPRGQARLETVAIIRDPIDWLGSWYRYRQRPFLRGKPKSTYDHSFSEFVEAYLSADQPAFADIGSQARFLTSETGALLVDHLFPYGTLSSFKEFMQRRLGVSLALTVENASPVPDGFSTHPVSYTHLTLPTKRIV